MFLKTLIVVYFVAVILYVLFHSFSFWRPMYFARPSGDLLAYIGFYKDRIANELWDGPERSMYQHEWQTWGISAVVAIVLAYVVRNAPGSWSFAYFLAMAIHILTMVLVDIGIRQRIDRYRGQCLKGMSRRRPK